MITISKPGAPILNVAVNELSILNPSKSLNRKVEQDCITIPRYTRSDGTVVEEHQRCIDRVISGGSSAQEKRDEQLSAFEGSERFKDLRIAQSFKELETRLDSGIFSGAFRDSLRDVAEGEVIFTKGDREFPLEKLEGLSDTQNAVVNMYSSSLSQINEQIIDGQLTEAGSFYVEALNQALDDAPKLAANEMVFRGIRVDDLRESDLKQYTDNINGDLVNFEAFTSTTRDSNMFFALEGPDRVNYEIFTADGSRAVDVAPVSSFDENEVLFPTDSKFHILGVEYDEETGGKIILKEYDGSNGPEREFEKTILDNGFKARTENFILEFVSDNFTTFYDDGEYVLLDGGQESRFSSLQELLDKIN